VHERLRSGLQLHRLDVSRQVSGPDAVAQQRHLLV
jgi:hypothetical protein